VGVTYLGLALLSAATLAFEISLTRWFSVTQWYHFAFLAVSVALLGYGASGTALSLVPRWTDPPTARRTSLLAILFSASVVGAYLSLNYLPFDSYRIAWERVQVLYLVLYYLALTLPFFCAGLVTGLLLAAYPELTSRFYAANLLGSALGGMLPLLILPLAGEGAVLIITAIGFVAAVIFLYPQTGSILQKLTLLGLASLLLILALFPPNLFQLRLSPYKGLSQVLRFPDAEIISQQWNAFSRVDLVTSSAIRSAPGLSLSYPGELPQQDGMFVDGEDLSAVVDTADLRNVEILKEFTGYLPVALPYQLRPAARVLLLEPRGGLDIWVALNQGVSFVKAVEGNPLLAQTSEAVYGQHRVQLVLEEGRSYAHRSEETFDLVHLVLGDSYRPVTSGAYSLGERYDLTVEAFQDYMARLEPGGLLVVERWLQLPPSELLRAGATAVEALRQAGVKDPAPQLAVLRSWQVGLILVKNGAFTTDELATIRAFGREQGLDLVALPGLTEAEVNQLNVLEQPVYWRAFSELLADPDAVYAEQPFNVQPTTDNRPFFFHFFKWAQTRAILQQLGKTWQPWGGSGVFILIALLAVGLVASAVLILLPLALAPAGRTKLGGKQAPRGRMFAYFGLLGLGFLFVEIPLMQRFILFLGQPVLAFTAVLASILLFSGLGSLASPRLPAQRVLPLLVIAILLYPLALPLLIEALLGAPMVLRLLATGLCLAPLGFLMGLPFPSGLNWLRQRAPNMIPWAWAINGSTSVLASILAAMIALSAGFTWVLVAAALAYAGAWLAIR
jgi:hypothetical protein